MTKPQYMMVVACSVTLEGLGRVPYLCEMGYQEDSGNMKRFLYEVYGDTTVLM